MKNLLLCFLTLVICTAPALSYAKNCCCLKSAQKQSMSTSHDDMTPCHEMDTEKPKTNHLCLCDAGLHSLIEQSNQAMPEHPVFYKSAYDLEKHHAYASQPPERLLRPPIMFS